MDGLSGSYCKGLKGWKRGGLSGSGSRWMVGGGIGGS